MKKDRMSNIEYRMSNVEVTGKVNQPILKVKFLRFLRHSPSLQPFPSFDIRHSIFDIRYSVSL